jgi:hypothetical protein
MLGLSLSVLLLAAGPLRPVNTYSIVARDPATGELGVAVQSHWFSVGPGAWAGGGRRGARNRYRPSSPLGPAV